MTLSALLPFACSVLIPPPPRQAFNSLLPLGSPWAHPDESGLPCPADPSYSRQGPKVAEESKPAGKQHPPSPPSPTKAPSPARLELGPRGAIAAAPPLLRAFLRETLPFGFSFSLFPSLTPSERRSPVRTEGRARRGDGGDPRRRSVSLRRGGQPPPCGRGVCDPAPTSPGVLPASVPGARAPCRARVRTRPALSQVPRVSRPPSGRARARVPGTQGPGLERDGSPAPDAPDRGGG